MRKCRIEDYVKRKVLAKRRCRQRTEESRQQYRERQHNVKVVVAKARRRRRIEMRRPRVEEVTPSRVNKNSK